MKQEDEVYYWVDSKGRVREQRTMHCTMEFELDLPDEQQNRHTTALNQDFKGVTDNAKRRKNSKDHTCPESG